MSKVDLSKSDEIYPYIFLPEIIKNHINKGYNQTLKVQFLGLEIPEKSKEVKFGTRFYSPDPIDIENILNLKYDSVNEDLENYTSRLGNYTLPKKPLLHHIEEREKINYDKGFDFIIHSLVFLPICGLCLYMIFAIFGPLFISYEERMEISVWPFLIYGSLLIYIIFLGYGIFRKDNQIFERYIHVKRTILEESKRVELLDRYKAEVNSILERYNKDYEKDVKAFEDAYLQGSQLAEIGILKQMLSDSNVDLIDNRNLKKGKSELKFLEHLYNTFGRNIFTDYSPNVGKNPFQPDFILFDSEIDFYLDIEVDEPYSLLDGTTIHHDRTKDAERNKFFNSINWGVIRLSEKQVIQNPEECCSLIQNVLTAIKKRKDHVKHNIPTEKCWTHEEALIMKLQKYRQSY